MSSGYVYAIGDGIGNYKIGKANNTLKRLKALQTANPRKLSIIREWKTSAPMAMEGLLHSKLGRYKTRGEWFKCSVKIIDKAWQEVTTERPKGKDAGKRQNWADAMAGPETELFFPEKNVWELRRSIPVRFKKLNGKWVGFGPVSALSGSSMQIMKQDGSVVEKVIERTSNPFDVDGVPHCFAHFPPDTARRWATPGEVSTARYPD